MRGLIFFLLAVIMGSGAMAFLDAENTSMQALDINSIINVLKEHKIAYYLFSNERGNQFLVVPKFGARIFAVSVEGESLFWTHPDILKGQGGQRSWISPEGGAKGFIFRPDWKGQKDFSAMDPGDYKVVHFEENEHLILQNRFQTTSNDGKEDYDLTLTRELRHLDDPLQGEPGFEELHYSFLGIAFVHRLRNNSQALLDRILALWCLIQVAPKGTMVVPVQKVESGKWRGNYFEPIPERFVKANPDSFSFFIHGSQRYKVGIRPESCKGIICYLAKARSQDFFMVVMTFPVMPEERYVDRPKEEQESDGDAIQIYSHLEEGLLAFGELECHSWGLKLQPDAESAFPIKIFLYKAPLDVLKSIGKKLICPHFDEAHIFKE